MFPLLAQHVTEVVFRLDPMKIDDISSYGFPDPVQGQNVVPCTQSGVGKGSTGHNRPVVTKHEGF